MDNMSSSDKRSDDHAFSPDLVGHYVYLYRDTINQQVRYVGYGQDPQRAISHAGTSHNPDLRRWLENRAYDLQVAGPYGTAHEGLHVEAALISVIKPTFNIHPGTGPKFRPLGVPLELAHRVALPKLKDKEIAIRSGGAIFVRLAGGMAMTDGTEDKTA